MRCRPPPRTDPMSQYIIKLTLNPSELIIPPISLNKVKAVLPVCNSFSSVKRAVSHVSVALCKPTANKINYRGRGNIIRFHCTFSGCRVWTDWFSDVVMCFLRPAGLHRMEREWAECGRVWSMNWRLIEVTYFLFIWNHITVQSSRREPSANEQHVTKQFDWLISDRGPFHHSKGYLSFMERFRQGFTTRYKIYRWVINTMLVCTVYGLCSWLYMSFCWVLLKWASYGKLSSVWTYFIIL